MKRKTALERKHKKASEILTTKQLYMLIGREKFHQLIQCMKENNMSYLDFGELNEYLKEREEKERNDKKDD